MVNKHISAYRMALADVTTAKEQAAMMRPDFKIKKAGEGHVRVYYSVDPQNDKGYWSVQIYNYNGMGMTESVTEDDLVELKHALQRWFPGVST